MASVQWTGGTEHWTHKGDIRLFLWNKPAHSQVPKVGTILFVHGSSMASQPTFDLSVPGRPHSSVMDWFAERGFDTWCMDNEGYGRSDKNRLINFDIANGAEVASPLLVKFGVEGIAIAPAGTDQPASGHHHLVIDAELPAFDAPVPASSNYVHFGKGQTETTIELTPGTHTLQLLFANYLHVPFNPSLASEKITVTVK